MRSEAAAHPNGATLGQKTLETEKAMGELIVVGIVIGIAVWMYKAGKRIGSRKGFNAGRWRRRQR
jgi:hypothetical protein